MGDAKDDNDVDDCVVYRKIKERLGSLEGMGKGKQEKTTKFLL